MTDKTYPVVSHFNTLQGEGHWSGHASYFIRLAGCDVGCTWCDTKESWSLEGHPNVGVAELVTAAKRAGARTVVVTGGEPTMHDLAPLTEALADVGCRIHLETSGAHALTGSFDWITLSPKKFKPPVPSAYDVVDELKIVVANLSDFEWAELHKRRCPSSIKAMLQPEWDSPHMLPAMVDYVKKHPEWTISLQTHKYLNIP